MTDARPLIGALEQALDAHAAALSSPDPTNLERANEALATLLSTLGRNLGHRAAPALPAGQLEQLRARIAAHGGVIARAASGNRAALAALGLPDSLNAALPAYGSRHRRTTHLQA